MNTIYLLPIFYYIRPIDEFETIRNPLSSDLAAFISSGFIYQKRIESNFLRNDLKGKGDLLLKKKERKNWNKRITWNKHPSLSWSFSLED